MHKGLLCLLVLVTAQIYGRPPNLRWKDLRGYNVSTQSISPRLLKFNKQSIRIVGYVVPLTDYNWSSLSEFLLVPSPTACIHAPPPPLNQMIYVKMQPGKRGNFEYGAPFIIEGKLSFAKTKSPYGNVLIRIDGSKTMVYK